jgi:protein involved in polysaccharide export with SLBB domain
MLEGAVDPNSYIVGPGDRLLIELWGLRDLSTEIEVNAEGRLSVPSVGVFAAGGEKLAALREAINARLRAVYPKLNGNVSLVRPRTFQVNILGAVARPGPYPATALTRVSSLIPSALPLPTSSTRKVEIRRKGRKDAIIADIVNFNVLGDPSGNPTLLDGDKIFVPVRELEVEVSGAVKRPGRYELVREKNVRELLDLAGGLASDVASTLPLRVTTREGGDRLIVRSLSQATAAVTALRSGDRVHVPSLTDLSRTVVVEGAIVGNPSIVATPSASGETLAVDPDRRVPSAVTSSDRPVDLPGSPSREVSVQLPYVEGDGVSDLISKAGGLQPWADASAAYLLRPLPDGDRRRIPVDVTAITSRKAPEVPIQPGDTMVIPGRRDAVMVGGAVQHPGLFPYSRNLHPPDYITLAGGPTRTGQAGSAVVLKRSGEGKKISAVKQIDPGDVISVPESGLTTFEWVEIILTIANLAVAITSVIVLTRVTR